MWRAIFSTTLQFRTCAPSKKTSLTALATQALSGRAMKEFGAAPANFAQVVLGLRDVGELLSKDARIPVVSTTGSTRMGRELAPVAHMRRQTATISYSDALPPAQGIKFAV
jgi:acyl-CoA reductase-like NAD-dependent aldehyde dehydrogenase